MVRSWGCLWTVLALCVAVGWLGVWLGRSLLRPRAQWVHAPDAPAVVDSPALSIVVGTHEGLWVNAIQRFRRAGVIESLGGVVELKMEVRPQAVDASLAGIIYVAGDLRAGYTEVLLFDVKLPECGYRYEFDTIAVGTAASRVDSPRVALEQFGLFSDADAAQIVALEHRSFRVEGRVNVLKVEPFDRYVLSVDADRGRLVQTLIGSADPGVVIAGEAGRERAALREVYAGWAVCSAMGGLVFCFYPRRWDDSSVFVLVEDFELDGILDRVRFLSYPEWLRFQREGKDVPMCFEFCWEPVVVPK